RRNLQQITRDRELLRGVPNRGEARMSSNPFIDHPASVGETYGEHLVTATGFGLRMIFGGVACLVHGLLPFLFVRTGSRTIAELNDRMTVSRRPLPPLSGERQRPLSA